MRKKVLGLIMIALSHGAVWGDIHDDAAQCRLSSSFSETCWNVCVQCHARSNPIVGLDLYISGGDVRLCEQCHPRESLPGSGTQLLRLVDGGGGNHPVAILYSPEGSKTLLVPSPSGPKFFTDEGGNNPKVFCSTCHNPHASSTALLRVGNQGSALCLSCHIK